jgi:FkbM family methyltransferase
MLVEMSKYTYYAKSVVSLLTRFQRPDRIAAIFLGLPWAVPAVVSLRKSHWRFRVREAMDVWVIKESCLDGGYLRQTALLPTWQVLDIGAGLGDFTILAAHQCAGGVVHAYEPLADSFALLKENLSLNGIGNVQAFQLAVSAAGGSQVVACREADRAVSTRFEAGQGAGAIASRTLGDALKALPGGRCDFLKLDCEGCEYELLMNSPRPVLEQIQRLAIETHDFPGLPGQDALARFLESCGYEVIIRPNPVHDYLGLLFAEQPPSGR